MGMAASQARFLQLTARRTNIEYMGQQINQQRLALANQSAGLFEKMLTLEPPVPPSSLDDKYYTQGYTFTDGVNDDGTNVFQGDGVSKKVTWYKAGDTSAVGAPASLPAATDNLFTIDVIDDTALAGDGGDDSTAASLTVSYQDLMSDEQVDSTGTLMQDLMTTLGFSEQDDTQRSVVRYVSVTHNIYDPDGNYQTVTENAPAILEFDNLERLINVTLMDDITSPVTVHGDYNVAGGDVVDSLSDAAAGTINSSTYTPGAADSKTIGQGEDLTYSGQFDEDAYSDDMNEYEFKKSAYDYQIERINIETSKIQKQDKSLELKMKQLDTEHNAVQTEMEAVQKVIQKNIEGSFKTFA